MKDDERQAFEKLYRAEFAGVVRTAFLICGNREDALDLAQEAFARACDRWKTVEALDRPAAWLQRVVANLAVSWRRRRRRTAVWSAPEGATPAREPEDPGVVAALRELTPAQRAVVVLRYYADQSVEEVARALHKSPGSIRVLAFKGLGKLRELLPKEDVDDDPRR